MDVYVCLGLVNRIYSFYDMQDKEKEIVSLGYFLQEKKENIREEILNTVSFRRKENNTLLDVCKFLDIQGDRNA